MLQSTIYPILKVTASGYPRYRAFGVRIFWHWITAASWRLESGVREHVDYSQTQSYKAFRHYLIEAIIEPLLVDR